MGALAALHMVHTRINSFFLSIGRNVAWVLMALMVVVILMQVFYRYVLNSPLSWPEEASLSLMIWMMGLMAPSAYRWGGFVAIDLLSEALPKWPRFALVMALMLIATGVSWFLLREAWTHFSSPILFNSSGLNRLVQDSGINQLLGTNIEFRAAYIYLGMVACFVMLLSVNIELIIRKLGRTFGDPDQFPNPIPPSYMAAGAGAE